MPSKKSLMYLIGRKEWDQVRDVVTSDLEIQEKLMSDTSMATTHLTFAINFQAPWDIIECLLTLNPNILVSKQSEVTMILASVRGNSMSTLLCLEERRQSRTVVLQRCQRSSSRRGLFSRLSSRSLMRVQ